MKPFVPYFVNSIQRQLHAMLISMIAYTMARTLTPTIDTDAHLTCLKHSNNCLDTKRLCLNTSVRYACLKHLSKCDDST
jgi:hypothetical protein